jgi:hypothetical protein
MRTVFVLGKEEDAYNGSAIQVEADEHKDMLVGDFVDNYFNNTMKYVSFLVFEQPNNQIFRSTR